MLDRSNELPDEILEKQRKSWQRGKPLAVEEILRSSSHQDNRDALLDLIYNEIVVQEELGLNPSFDGYLKRYPHLEEELELHFEVHQAVNQQLLLETAFPRTEKSWPPVHRKRLPMELPTEDYEVTGLIGEGGMAVVYQARHRQLHRDVALKIFQPGRVLTSREIFRIRTEAKAMARLAHPNIVQIYDIGECHGTPYLAIEFAEQGTLARRLQQFSFTPATAANLIETLARALHHAHERKVIHRDLKPANILFARDGTPKITDFGLAKVLQDQHVSSAEMTQTGEAMGTPRYMAPEQAAGRHDLVCPATDVYALGTLLYECLTGRAPFTSTSVVETLRRICTEDPLPPRRFLASIPRDLETICLHCLDKDPQCRYSTTMELAEDLNRFQHREPISVRAVSLWERTWKWCKKKPAHAALIALTVSISSSGLFAAMIGPHLENRRIAELRNEVARLVCEGRKALEFDELELAQSRFQEAWQKVQAEPELSDHETSVTGWLDHSRNALNRYQWKQRVRPRDFDDRRDEALLQSLLLIPYLAKPTEAARTAIQSALELTVPNEGAWKVEREQLVLLETEMIARESGVSAAFAFLDSTNEFNSRRFHLCRASLLRQLHRFAEAENANHKAEQFPSHVILNSFHQGMTELRGREFKKALSSFELVLSNEPEHFVARLFQSICFLNLNRPREAKVALTACVAQRPRFLWSYFFRSQAHLAVGEPADATHDLYAASEGRASLEGRYVTLVELGILELQRRQIHAANHAFLQLTELFPNESSCWALSAWTEMMQGNQTQAAICFDNALKIRPNLPAAVIGKSIIQLANGDVVRAKQDVDQALDQLKHSAPDLIRSNIAPWMLRPIHFFFVPEIAN